MRVVVVGASRGIGYELARQCAAAGDQVIASYRQPEHRARLQTLGATPVALDVRDDSSPAQLMAAIGEAVVDWAIINAGRYGPRTTSIEAPAQLDFDDVMHTNVLAAMRFMPALAPALAHGGKLAVISSRMGSISMMSGVSGWLYRASKAALNAALKAASNELGPRGIVCLALHPGWVRTDMGGAAAEIEVETSVAGMRQVIATADRTHNGRFFNYDGSELSW